MKTLFTLLLACLVFNGYAQQPVISLKHSDLATDIFIHLDKVPWLFNGSYSYKQASLSTDNWQTISGTDFGTVNAPPNWTGNGWFAIWVKADAALAGRKLAIQINHDGASEIYVDGKPAGGYGKLGYSASEMEAARSPKSLIPFWPADTLPHLIAVHYANYKGTYPDFLGFQLAIGDYNVASKRIAISNHRMNFLLVTVGAYFILGFLFLFLFIFYPTQKLNIYYAVFVLLLGITMLSIYFFYETGVPQIQFFAERSTYNCKILMMWFGSMMLYAVGYKTIPRSRLLIVSAISIVYILLEPARLFVFKTYEWDDHFSIVFFLFTIDGFISIYRAVKRKLPDVWLIAIGMAAITLVYFFAWGDVFSLWPQQLNSLRVLVIAIGNLVFPACFSFYLALDFARTNQQLAKKLEEVEILYTKNLKQEAEKLELVSGEAKRLEATVKKRTAEIQLQADKLKEMDAVKSRFFTNITHEFKTPLTLMINPAQELLAKSTSALVQTNATLIENNAQRLLQLINQLLDLSQLENAVMENLPEPVELVQETEYQMTLFRPLAIQKEISLSFASDWLSMTVKIDKDKLTKILHNLLSNSIKFSQGGSIEVSVTALRDMPGQGFRLMVKDTGSGIPEDKLPYIFERFYQADRYDTRSHEGSGIGLALTSELVLLMGGTIDAESKEGFYTKITVELPCEIDKEEPAQDFIKTEINNGRKEQKMLPEEITAMPGKQLILVIEDNQELRNFLSAALISIDYNVVSVPDGKAGVAIAKEQIPDVVITDIMMPGADGYWVCDTLKSNETTSHIPIIFLTAKSDAESRIKGIRTGADAYLGKPFSQQELDAVIKNLIAIRNLLQKKYSNSLVSIKSDTVIPSIEQAFINRVHAFIDEHLDDQQFGAEQLAVLMTLSRSQLHRKLKGLLGKSAGELIRNARMEHAIFLLKNSIATIAEVAYMVGFSSPSAFATSFSRQFGYPPSEIVQGTNLV